MWRLIFIVASVILSACTSKIFQQNQELTIANNVSFTLLSPQSYGHNLSLTQVASIEYHDQTETLLFHTIIDHQQIVLFGLTANGVRLFTITYRNNQIETDGFSQVVEAIKPEYLLADLQLALWPIERLQANLQSSLHIQKNDNQRIFTQQDEPIIEIQYWPSDSSSERSTENQSNNKAFAKVIEFSHLQRNYKLHLTTEDVSITSLTKTASEQSND